MENLNEIVVEPVKKEVVKINGNGTGEKTVVTEDDKKVKEKIND